MTENDRKLISIEVLHLDDQGYGPKGQHTRQQWRDECLRYLFSGPENFKNWQKANKRNSTNNLTIKSFDIKVLFSDGTNFIYGRDYRQDALDYIGVYFQNKVDLKNHTFLIDTYFNYSTFSKEARFDYVSYKSDVDFSSALFEDETHFHNATFISKSYFRYTHFNNSAFFNYATFKDSLRFTYASFHRDIFFENVTALNRAKFSHLTINRDAYFKGSKFFDETRFNRVYFKGDADFNSVEFHKSVFFQKAKFTNSASFVRASFSQNSDFKNSEFGCMGNFWLSEFRSVNSNIPDFRGCKIDSTRLEFSNEEYFSQQNLSDDEIQKISCLKRLSDEQGLRDQALNFNAMELRARRRNTWQNLQIYSSSLGLRQSWAWQLLHMILNVFKGDFWFCAVTWLYEVLSDFGRSFTKPIFYLMALMVISYTFCIISAFEHSSLISKKESRQPIFSELSAIYSNLEDAPMLTGYRAAAEYSLYRSGNFLDFTDADKSTKSVNVRLFGQEIEPWWARMFGFTKGILTATLLFLTALGLRNRYRIS